MITTHSQKNKHDYEIPIRCDGIDPDWFHFSMESRSRKGLVHEMHVDRRTGVIVCSCEDAVYRKKRGDVMDLGFRHACYHVTRLMHEFKAILA